MKLTRRSFVRGACSALALGVADDPKNIAPLAKGALRKEIRLHDVEGIRQYAAEIAAGRVSHDLSQPINMALQHFERVIVPRGVYPISGPILLALSQQELLFEDNAWFLALNAWTNGISVPNGCLNCSILNPGLIGASRDEGDCGVGQHTAILWNSNATGTAPFGSAFPDDMAGRVECGRFKGATDLTGWHTAIHSNMARGFAARHCHVRGLIGTSSGHGYGHLFSGSDVLSEGHSIDGHVPLNGRHGIYLGDQCSRATVRDIVVRNTRKSGIAANTGVTDGNSRVRISQVVIEQSCLDMDSSATNAALELNYQGSALEGGGGIHIDNIKIKESGNSGLLLRGYRGVVLSNIFIDEWGKAGGGNYAGLEVENCTNVSVVNFHSRTSAHNDKNQNYIQHILIRKTKGLYLEGGSAINTGIGEQRSAVSLDTTPPGNQEIRIRKFRTSNGNGSWTKDPCVNCCLVTFDPIPDLRPARMRIPALHRLGSTPAEEANSAGVMSPRDV